MKEQSGKISWRIPKISVFISWRLMILIRVWVSERIEMASIPRDREKFMADRMAKASAIRGGDTCFAIVECCDGETRSSTIQPSHAALVVEFQPASVKTFGGGRGAWIGLSQHPFSIFWDWFLKGFFCCGIPLLKYQMVPRDLESSDDWSWKGTCGESHRGKQEELSDYFPAIISAHLYHLFLDRFSCLEDHPINTQIPMQVLTNRHMQTFI